MGFWTVGALPLGGPGCFGPRGATIVLPAGFWTATLALVVWPWTSTLALVVWLWTSTVGAGAVGGPDDTPAPVVPTGVAVDVVAVTPPEPAETFALV